MGANPRELDAAIAATRFGLGARPGEIADASADPRAFLKRQIRPEGAEIPASDGMTGAQRLEEYREAQRALRDARNSGSNDPGTQIRRVIGQTTTADALARIRLATATPAGFRERWALFWANHFTVSSGKRQAAAVIGPYEATAIRPHVFGRFADLLVAAETHPAMLIYLDQIQSVGPDTKAAARIQQLANRGPGGLNENLAREILELHTVGVGGGYAQADVTEFARALTGWGVGGGPLQPDQAGETLFRDAAHEPGERTVMRVQYAQAGREQSLAVLTDLATRPQTARFVCTKIARHFVADDPPPPLVRALERTWLNTGGDLTRVAQALIDAPEAWAPQPAKFKTPYEFVVSSWRALGAEPRTPNQVGPVLRGMGQPPFGAPSPKGWPDEAGPWATADAVVKRMQFAQDLAGDMAGAVADPKALAHDTLGARLTLSSATMIARAESRAEAVALLLMSPEFQRR